MSNWLGSKKKNKPKKILNPQVQALTSDYKLSSKETSIELFKKAKKLFPGGVNSPVRSFSSVGGNPLFIKKGKDCYVCDEDDNIFIDYCSSWGALITGHANTHVLDALKSTLEQGTSFGAPTRLENELAEYILSKNRYIEKIRFVNSGTEAVMSAVRLARGYTGKNKIIKFTGCYHGHMDALLMNAGSGLADLSIGTSAGIPENYCKETVVVFLKDKKALSDAVVMYKDDVAAVIIEPVPANNGLLLMDKEYLEHLRKECSDNGILLIFDEVISGFRLGLEGAAGHYDIQPDIVTFGKIIGGGLPVGAFAASKEIMDSVSPLGKVYQAGTLSGNPLAMAAGLANLKQLRPDVYTDLNTKTSGFVKAIRHFCKARSYPVRLYDIGSIFWFSFSPKDVKVSEDIEQESMEKYALFHNKLLNRGIYLPPSGYEVCFMGTKHTKIVLEKTKSAIFKTLDEIYK